MKTILQHFMEKRADTTHEFSHNDDTWNVYDLWEASKALPEEDVLLSDLPPRQPGDWSDPDSTDHLERIDEADLSYPILLTPEGQIADGQHRREKALRDKLESIKAKRFEEMPDPIEKQASPARYLYHTAPATAEKLINQEGLLSSILLARKPKALQAARPRGADDWRARLFKELRRPHRYGPNAFFQLPPRGTKLPDDHVLRDPSTSLYRIAMDDVLQRHPRTRFYGLELSDYRKLQDIPDPAWYAMPWRDRLKLRRERRHFLGGDELNSLLKRSPEDLWRNYSGDKGMYAPNVPHVSIITPTNKIEPDLIERLPFEPYT